MRTAEPIAWCLWRSAALALALFFTVGAAQAAECPGVCVQSIKVNGAPATTGVDVQVSPPGASQAGPRKLNVGDRLDVGCEIETPEKTEIVLVTANTNEITLYPRSRTKIKTVSTNGEGWFQLLGRVSYNVKNALSFFDVSHAQFRAAVNGTKFAVEVDSKNIEFEWIEGKIEVSRQVKMKIAGAEGDANPDGTVAVREVVSAANPHVSYRLNVDEYLKEFKTYADVEQYYRTELEKDKASKDPERELDGLNNLGVALVTVGKAKDAISYYTQALALNLKLYQDPDDPDLAGGYNNLGIAYGELRNAEKGIEYYKKALAIYVRLYPGGKHADIAGVLNNIGAVYLELKDDALKGIEYYEQALSIYSKLDPDSVQSEIAGIYNNLGVAFGELCDAGKGVEPDEEELAALCNQGIKYYEQALTIYKELYSSDVHPDIAGVYNNIGSVYVEHLDDALTGIKYFEKALRIYLKLYPNGVHPEVGKVYSNLAAAYEKTGNEKREAEYTRKAEAIQEKLSPPE